MRRIFQKPRIIDENIEAAMTRRSLIDQRTVGIFARHIDLGELGFAAGLRDASHSCFVLFGIASRYGSLVKGNR